MKGICCILTFGAVIMFQLSKQEDSDAWVEAAHVG